MDELIILDIFRVVIHFLDRQSVIIGLQLQSHHPFFHMPLPKGKGPPKYSAVSSETAFYILIHSVFILTHLLKKRIMWVLKIMKKVGSYADSK